jgi:hypothetical protein
MLTVMEESHLHTERASVASDKILVCCTRDWEAILTYRAVIIRYPSFSGENRKRRLEGGYP